jgi:hypothetical protein
VAQLVSSQDQVQKGVLAVLMSQLEKVVPRKEEMELLSRPEARLKRGAVLEVFSFEVALV